MTWERASMPVFRALRRETAWPSGVRGPVAEPDTAVSGQRSGTAVPGVRGPVAPLAQDVEAAVV